MKQSLALESNLCDKKKDYTAAFYVVHLFVNQHSNKISSFGKELVNFFLSKNKRLK